MATFSFTPHHRSSGSSGIYHIITASELKSLLRRSGSISWSWKTHRRLQQRCQRQQDSNPRTEQDLDDEGDSRRLSQNTGIFHPSIWGDFFLGCSSPEASSQQKVNLFMDQSLFRYLSM
jgi:hypothetical protein